MIGRLTTISRQRADQAFSGMSLVQRTLLRAALRIGLVVVVASLIAHQYVRNGMETQALQSLSRYVDERRARESQALDAAEASLASLAGTFLAERSTASADDGRFESLFDEAADGTLRTSRELLDRTGISGFVGKYARLSPEDRRTLVAGYELFERLGPALRDRFRNAYLVAPDNAVLMYWPDEPWALDSADWEIFGKLSLLQANGNDDVLVTGSIDMTENDQPVWSPLYFDYGVNQWVVSVTRPVVEGGSWIGSLGHDLYVQDLIDRVVRGDIDGAYNVLIDQKGMLIAHPDLMPAIQAHGGAIAIDPAVDPLLAELQRVARTADPAGEIVDLADQQVFVAATQLAGPGWHLMTVFPRSLIASQANRVAWLILAIGFIALVIELAMLLGVLRRLVGTPLQALAQAVDRFGQDPEGDFKMDAAVLARRDELGRLARAFQGMVGQLRERHAELSGLNRTLQQQLVQRQQAERELERHRELNALMNAIDYGVLFLDRDLNSRLANQAYLRMWKFTPDFYATSRNLREDMEESRRMGLYEVEDEHWPAYRERRIAAIRDGSAGPEEIALSDGRILSYQCTVLPDGGRMLTYFDITEMKRVELELRTHLQGMEASMDGMALLDPTGHYFYVNRAHAEVYAIEREKMIGRSWRELYDESELEQFENSVMPALQREGRWRGEAVGKRMTGASFPQELSLAVTETGGLVCVVRDITERKKRERAIDRAVRQAEESNAAKSRFLASMSHELRTPLNAIIGFTRIVARKTEGQIDPKQSDNLKKIQISAEQLLRLINDILDISKIEAGREDVAEAPYSPALLVVECARIIEPMLAQGVTVDTQAFDMSVGCLGDAAKVRQILTNLLSNGARHTTSGRIRISVERRDSRLQYRVEDTGPGIPPAFRELVFEEFGQARNQQGEVVGGTGLGLTISRRLARLMGGDVVLESEVGVGSTFILDLPFEPAPEPTRRQLEDTAATSGARHDG